MVTLGTLRLAQPFLITNVFMVAFVSNGVAMNVVAITGNPVIRFGND
jgi:hypothetical protein